MKYIDNLPVYSDESGETDVFEAIFPKKDAVQNITAFPNVDAPKNIAAFPGADVLARQEPAGDGSNERADVARRALELSETIAEAIAHMLGQAGTAPVGIAPMGYTPADATPPDIDACGVMLKDVGEGLISLKNAVSAISEKAGVSDEDLRALDWAYDELSECVEAMADAYIGDRASDFREIGVTLNDAFAAYSARLSDCCRSISII